MSGLLYLERLSDGDLALLAEAAGERGPSSVRAARVRSRPDRIEELLARPEVFDHVFGKRRPDPIVVVAPFLAFSVLLARTGQVLRGVQFIPEWVGPQQRVPVFAVASLREFLDDPLRRFFLADVLASYTPVASGSVVLQTPRGWRRRRFSELDPVRLIELAQEVGERERLPLYRRLGDLALFLTGVFPDFAGRRLLGGPAAWSRFRRVVGDSAQAVDPLEDPIALLEALGRRSYRLAWEGTEPRDVGVARTLGELSHRFGDARRVLNFLTDRYLYPHREHWFSVAD